MRHSSNTMVALLSAYHRSSAAARPPIFSDEEVWLFYERGLACIAASTLDLDTLSAESRELLRNAELTAQIIYDQFAETTVAVLEFAALMDIPVVLIKGIAVADAYYPAPHHRIMGDIDILVAENQAGPLQESMQQDGYSNADSGARRRSRKYHHHLPPIRHSRTGIVLEIHTGLFSHKLIDEEPLFGSSDLWTHAMRSEYRGVPCQHLTPEYQFLYAVAHWAVDQKWERNVVSINDVILMLNSNTYPLDWALIDGWLDENPRTADFLSVLLLFLKDVGLAEIPEQISSRLAVSAKRLGKLSIALAHWLIARFPLSTSPGSHWLLNGTDAQVLWQALFAPHPQIVRLPVAFVRLLAHKTRSSLGKLKRGATRLITNRN